MGSMTEKKVLTSFKKFVSIKNHKKGLKDGI